MVEAVLTELGRTIYLVIPLLGGAVFHGLTMKFDWLGFLKKPIDGGATFRGRRIFGENKTWRGFVAVAVGAMPVAAFQSYWLHSYPSVRSWEYFDYGGIQPLVFGFLMGWCSMFAELPNSFVKRQLDINPGEAGSGSGQWIFLAVDQVDLLVGVWVLLLFYFPPEWQAIWPPLVTSFVFIFVIHQLITVIGYFLGMRETWR